MFRSFFNAVDTAYTIDNIDGLPANEYRQRLEYYREMEQWYSGDALGETLVENGEEIELYPAKINPLPATVLKHAYMLFGETNADSSPLVSPKLVSGAGRGVRDSEILNLENVLRVIWNESAGRALQFTNGLLAQIYGGCVFKVDYVPWDRSRTYPIRISKIHPVNFFGVLYQDEEYRLREAWNIQSISAATARQFGVKLEDTEKGLYVEYWNDNEYRVTINGDPIKWTFGDVKIIYDGENPFGVVPVAYIPHGRTSGLFGESLISPLIGVVREMNARIADYGDAISDDSHNVPAIRNATNPGLINIGGKQYLDLGNNQSAIGMSGGEPDVFSFSDKSASDPMAKMVNELYKHYRRMAYMPAVADGEDEGSQRSGLTLAFRMWPLTSHVGTERVFWTDGLNHITRVIARFLASRNIGNVTQSAARAAIRQEWAPMLPRDREVMVNEAVQRITSGLGSPEAMLAMLGDTDNIPLEIKRILKWRTQNGRNNSNNELGEGVQNAATES